MLKSEMKKKIEVDCNIFGQKVTVEKTSSKVGICLCEFCPRHKKGDGKVFIYGKDPVKDCLPL